MKTIDFEVEVYTFQIDFVGHVSNIVYIEWLEIGRTKFMQRIGMPVERLAADGIVPVLTSTAIEYKQPLFLDDRVRVQMWLSELRHASACIEFRFFKEGDVLVASASQQGLFIDRESMQPVRVPRAIRSRFAPYLAKGEGVGAAS